MYHIYKLIKQAEKHTPVYEDASAAIFCINSAS